MSARSTIHGYARERPTANSRLSRRASFSIPERFKDGDDAQIDIAAPKTKRSQYMNQSFLSMVANVGSNAALEPEFIRDVGSLKKPEAREEEGLHPSYTKNDDTQSDGARHRQVKEGAMPVTRSPIELARSGGAKNLERAPRRYRQLEALDDGMSTSQILAPPMSHSSVVSDPEQEHSAPPQEVETSDDKDQSQPTTATGAERIEGARLPDVDSLSTRLAKIYGFDEVEEVDSDFPCWLLQSVLLQGHMYITQHHVCFYAYLSRKATTITKSGFLYKRGRQNPRYRRYWFVLKGSVLSYYTNPSDLYFPSGTIDLRSGTTAQSEGHETSQNNVAFSLNASGRTHRFKADSSASALEWVKQLQKAIFHAHNDGDSVKVSLPIRNMLDIEENPVVDFADTFKIRIIDNDETFAIDEYFFSFFNHGKDALHLLRARVTSNALNRESAVLKHKVAAHTEQVSESADTLETPDDIIAAMNTANLASTSSSTCQESPPRRNVSSSVQSPEKLAASMSPSDLSDSSDNGQSLDTTSVSASQILQRSDVFYRPSMQHRHNREALEQQSSGAHSGNIQTSPGHGSGANLVPPKQGLQQSSSTSTLQDLMRAGTYSLQGASGIAGLLRKESKRVSNVLASESKVYYEKVTNMWAGKTMHFDVAGGPNTAEQAMNADEDRSDINHGDRFRSYFALPPSEKLRATYHGYLNRVVPVFGKIYVSELKVCFRSLLPGTRTKMVLPLKDVETVEKEKGFRFGYSGLVIVVRRHEELFLEFAQPDARDDLAGVILQYLSKVKQLSGDELLIEDDATEHNPTKVEFEALEQARHNSPRDPDGVFQTVSIEDDIEAPPIIFDDPLASIIDFKPVKSQRITCLTIGSRGDVQPYIALCKGLLAEGHRPRIVTHIEFEPWIRHHGIDFAPVAGDPAEIMRLCVEHDMFTVSFFREATSKFRGWIDQLLSSSWQACQDSDILIESPSAMAGIHIAEALEIPYFRAFTMPWTRTRAYPHAFAVPSQKLGGNYNLLTYVMFDNVFWRAVAGQINRWRVKTLGLPVTNLDKMQINNIPFLYNFSSAVVPPPLDFSPWIRVTGYWFLDESKSYQPPEGLGKFIARAREDRKKIVYVGFGSIVIDDPAALTKTIVESVLKADVRCVLSKGWSDRLEKRDVSAPEFPLPPEIYSVKSVPHDWLFQHIDAAAHHGGAGTTGAGLRAGIPTIVKPFFGDQFFFGSRVETLGVGRCLQRINTSVFARALWEVTNSERMITKAKLLGEQIRSENGVDTAIEAIYRDLEYARSLVKSHRRAATQVEPEDTESWTLVGDESDSDQAPKATEPSASSSAASLEN